MISSLRGEKIFPVDEYCCVSIAGTAALGVEMARLFEVELEHYEKIEGSTLSFPAKANRLSKMVFDSLATTLQGLGVSPMLSGYDLDDRIGRIVSYDPLGGRTEEHEFYAIGSGSMFARGSLKKLHSPGLSEADALHVAFQAIYDAAEDDIYTTGADLAREVFPLVYVMLEGGQRRLSDEESATAMQAVVDGRRREPGGPKVRIGAGSD
jgi:proteasome beta subunit